MASGTIHIGLRMLFHKKSRLLLSTAGVAFAVLIMFMQLGFFNGINDSQANFARLLDTDLIVMSKKRKNLNKWSRLNELRIPQLRVVEGVRQVVPIHKASMGLKNSETKQLRRIIVYGFDPESSPFNMPGFGESANRLKVPGTVLFDRLSRDIYGPVEKRGTAELDGRNFRVIGAVDIGPNLVNDGAVLMSTGTFLSSGGRRAPTMALVRLQAGEDAATVSQRILAELPDDVLVISPQALYEREVYHTIKSAPVGAIFGIGMIVGLIIGTIICYQILFNEITDHIPQYATLKAMGYSNGFMRSVILEEALMLAIIGFIPGYIGSILIYATLQKTTALLMVLTPERAAIIFVLTIVMCLVAGLLALNKVLKADPADLY